MPKRPNKPSSPVNEDDLIGKWCNKTFIDGMGFIQNRTTSDFEC